MKLFRKVNLLFLFFVLNILINTHAKPFEKEIEELGDIFQFIIPTIAGSRALYDDKESFMQFLKHFIILNGSAHLLKILIKEKRPSYDKYDSFPSTHTTSAFGGATFMHFRYSFNDSIYLYLMAAFTGFSRVYAEKHYVHDVLAAIALSFLSSYIFVNKKNDNINYSFNYDLEKKGVYLGVNFNF